MCVGPPLLLHSMAARLINIIRIIIIPLIHFGTKFGSWEVVLTRTNDFHLFGVGCGGGAAVRSSHNQLNPEHNLEAFN